MALQIQSYGVRWLASAFHSARLFLQTMSQSSGKAVLLKKRQQAAALQNALHGMIDFRASIITGPAWGQGDMLTRYLANGYLSVLTK